MTDRGGVRGGRRAAEGRRRLRGPRPGGIVVGAAVLLGIVLLFWAADRAVRWGAETVLARAVQSATGVPERPEVHVQGGFVLVQALRGRYEDVEVTVPDLSSGPLRVETARARLTGVHLPFHDVLVQRARQVFVERSVAQASLTYADLNRYLDLTGRPLMVDAGDGEVRLTGSATVLGRRVTAAAPARLSAEAASLAIRPSEVHTETPLDEAGRLLLRQRFTVLVPLDVLPFGQDVDAVEVEHSGIAVRVRGEPVVLRP